MCLANQEARRIIIVHHASCIAVDAHLFFDGATGHAIARSRIAIGIENELRHNEQRNALHTFRCAIDTGQHQMNDVFRHVMLASRDENLLAGNLVGTIILWRSR